MERGLWEIEKSNLGTMLKLSRLAMTGQCEKTDDMQWKQMPAKEWQTIFIESCVHSVQGEFFEAVKKYLPKESSIYQSWEATYQKCIDEQKKQPGIKATNQGESVEQQNLETYAEFMKVACEKYKKNNHFGLVTLHEMYRWNKKIAGANEAKILEIMQKAGVAEFYRNSKQMLEFLYGKKPIALDENSLEVLCYVMGDGAFGTRAGYRREKNNKMFARILRRLMPSTMEMHRNYPILEQRPWYYPFAWIHYVFTHLKDDEKNEQKKS